MSFSKEFVNLIQTEETAEQLNALQTDAEVEAFFREHGVDIEAESENIPAEESCELEEESLDEVVGGISWKTLGKLTKFAGKLYKCNKATNWGRNGNKCICGVHSMFISY